MNRNRLRFRFLSGVRRAYVALISSTVIAAVILTVNTRVVAGVPEALVPLRHTFGTICDDLGSWSRVVGQDGKPRPDAVFKTTTTEALGTDLYLDRSLGDGDRRINVHVAYYTGMTIDNIPHVPERSWDNAGLRMSIRPEVVALDLDLDAVTTAGSPVNPVTGDPYPVVEVLELGRPVPVHLPVGTPEMTITQFDVNRDRSEKLVGGYFFIVDGRLTPNRKELATKDGYSCKVQLEYSGTRQDGEGSYAVFAEFVEIAEDLLPSLLPEIMHCLPDSPGIEGSAGPVESVGAPPVEATRPQKTNPRSNGDRLPNS
ncbi:MAG: hypothetical protein GY895_07865 [Phycisphaera sp.]|nr:hypothetical protein [Phycisphaera sp.]